MSKENPSFSCNFPMSMHSFHLKLNCIKHCDFLRITHIGKNVVSEDTKAHPSTFPPSLELAYAGNEQDCLSQWGSCGRETVQYWAGIPTLALSSPDWLIYTACQPPSPVWQDTGSTFFFVASEGFGHQKVRRTSWGGDGERPQLPAAPVLCRMPLPSTLVARFSRTGP